MPHERGKFFPAIKQWSKAIGIMAKMPEAMETDMELNPIFIQLHTEAKEFYYKQKKGPIMVDVSSLTAAVLLLFRLQPTIIVTL
jgi:hypothetical protein